MKYLKRYRLFESKETYDVNVINDLLLDLVDKEFLVEIRPPSFRTKMRLSLDIIYAPGSVSTPFKLGDIQGTITEVIDYMKSEAYFVDDTDAWGPNDFRRKSIDKDPSKWDKEEYLTTFQIYFDKDLDN
jgi:hypothetical protein